MKFNPLVIAKVKEFVDDEILKSEGIILGLKDESQIKQGKEELVAVKLMSDALSSFKRSAIEETPPVFNFSLYSGLTVLGVSVLKMLVDNLSDGSIPIKMSFDGKNKNIILLSTENF